MIKNIDNLLRQIDVYVNSEDIYTSLDDEAIAHIKQELLKCLLAVKPEDKILNFIAIGLSEKQYELERAKRVAKA